jgi:hypothetical protein
MGRSATGFEAAVQVSAVVDCERVPVVLPEPFDQLLRSLAGVDPLLRQGRECANDCTRKQDRKYESGGSLRRFSHGWNS